MSSNIIFLKNSNRENFECVDNCDWICYILITKNNLINYNTYPKNKWKKKSIKKVRIIEKTYVGITPNFSRRLHHHNNVPSKTTKKTRGRFWVPAFIISGFKSEKECRRFEFYMHLLKRPKIWKKRISATVRKKKFSEIGKRIIALKYLISCGWKNKYNNRNFSHLNCYLYTTDDFFERLLILWQDCQQYYSLYNYHGL